jgi:arsenite transporter
MGTFERYLSIWVGLSIIFGMLFGIFFPGIFSLIASLEYASVNFVIAILIWVMIYPMMIQVDFSSLSNVGKKPKGLCVTLVVNWLIKPFTMAALGVLFFEYVFASYVDPVTAKEYIAGMILLGVAPCTAMVFVWSQLTKGDPNYTLVQVSLNDIIMVFAFAPIAAFLLGANNIFVPWETLLLSVVLYVIIPLGAGYLTRKILNKKGSELLIRDVTSKIKPFSIFGLLLTVVLLFAFQAETIINKPFAILLISIPLILQSYTIFFIAYLWSYLWKIPHSVAAPAALIGTSNFFELAVAVAISLFGLHSGAALATVVGVLVEVPVMLSLVSFSNRTRELFENERSKIKK